MVDFVQEGEFRERHLMLQAKILFFWDDPRKESLSVEALAELEQEMATAIEEMQRLKRSICDFTSKYERRYGREGLSHPEVAILLKMAELDASLIADLQAKKARVNHRKCSVRGTDDEGRPHSPLFVPGPELLQPHEPLRPEAPPAADVPMEEAPRARIEAAAPVDPPAQEGILAHPAFADNPDFLELARLDPDQTVTKKQLIAAFSYAMKKMGDLHLANFNRVKSVARRVSRYRAETHDRIVNLTQRVHRLDRDGAPRMPQVLVRNVELPERPAEPVPFLPRPGTNNRPVPNGGRPQSPEQNMAPLPPGFRLLAIGVVQGSSRVPHRPVPPIRRPAGGNEEPMPDADRPQSPDEDFAPLRPGFRFDADEAIVEDEDATRIHNRPVSPIHIPAGVKEEPDAGRPQSPDQDFAPLSPDFRNMQDGAPEDATGVPNGPPPIRRPAGVNEEPMPDADRPQSPDEEDFAPLPPGYRFQADEAVAEEDAARIPIRPVLRDPARLARLRHFVLNRRVRFSPVQAVRPVRPSMRDVPDNWALNRFLTNRRLRDANLMSPAPRPATPTPRRQPPPQQ